MTFEERLNWLKANHDNLISLKNEPVYVNGVYERYKNPVLTGAHAPLFWRYDLNPETNPYLEEIRYSRRVQCRCNQMERQVCYGCQSRGSGQKIILRRG